MTLHPSRSALRPVLLAAVSALALRSTASVAADMAPAKDAPLNTDTLLSLYLSTRPALLSDPAFARDWTVAKDCDTARRMQRDEFRGPAYLKAGAADLLAMKPIAPSTYVLRLDRYLDKYDLTKGEFKLDTLTPGATLALGIQGWGGENAQSYTPGCVPEGGSYPVEYDVRFDNASVANGLPMAPDQAEAYARSRTDRNGSRDTRVTVVLTVKLTMGEPRANRTPTVIKGVIVPVTAHIVDIAVENRDMMDKAIYRVSEAKLKAGEAEAAALREDERVRASAKPLTRELLAEQFRTQVAGAKVGDQPTRLFVDGQWTSPDAIPANYRYWFGSDSTYQLGDIMLRFDNLEEARALPPSPGLMPTFARHNGPRTAITYVPVGAHDDPQQGGRVVVGHILSLDSLTNDGGPERLVQTATKSPAVSWKAPAADTRLANAFDVLGIKTGMTPGEVARIAKSELGQVLNFDEATGKSRTTNEQCLVGYSDGGAPPQAGGRCVEATFLKAPGKSSWALARLEFTQVIPEGKAQDFFQGVKAKFGKIDLAQRYPGRLVGFPPQPVQSEAAGWGARLSDKRDDMVPFPLHPAEAITEYPGDVVVVRLVLTDLAAFTAIEDAKAAEARKKSEGVAPKF